MDAVYYERPSEHLERGRTLLNIGRPREALEEFQAALSENPQSSEAEALMAAALSALDKHQAAEQHICHALTLDPQDPFSHFVYGLILHDMQRDAEAEREYLNAIYLNPILPDCHARYALLLYRNGQVEKAKKIAKNALRFDPENVEALQILGHANMDEWDVDIAQSTFQRALAIDPESSETHAGMGLTHLHNNQSDKARDELRESLRLDPNNEYAQELYFQAVKTRHPLYSLFWRWSLSLKRLGRVQALFLILGLWLLVNIIHQVKVHNAEFFANYPIANYAVSGLLIIYVIFCIYTWVADPIFNFLARRGWIK